MKNSRFDQPFSNAFRRALADFPWLGPTLSAVLVAMVVNVLADTLTRYGVGYGWAFIGFLVAATLVFVYWYNLKYQRWLRNLGPIADVEKPAQHQGLIALVSRKELLRAALEYHRPVLKHCWLIITPEMQAVAAEISTEFSDVRFSTLPISNLYDTQACYEIVRHIYQKGASDIGLEPQEVIADITGGTKPMTMGMIIACLEGGFPIEHVPTQYDSTGKPLGPLPPIEIRVRKA